MKVSGVLQLTGGMATGLGVPVLHNLCSKSIYCVGVCSVPSLVGQGYQGKLLQSVATAIAGVLWWVGFS